MFRLLTMINIGTKIAQFGTYTSCESLNNNGLTITLQLAHITDYQGCPSGSCPFRHSRHGIDKCRYQKLLHCRSNVTVQSSIFATN